MSRASSIDSALDEIAAFERFRETRNKALRELNLDYARTVIPHASSDEVLIIAMHKARYECVDIEPELRHASGAWLRDRGYGRFRGELLPAGELPE